MRSLTVFVVAMIVVILMAIDNAKLRMENVDHVREHAELVWRINDISSQNKKLTKELYNTTEKHKMEISSKDIKIKKLIQIVVELYQMIRDTKNQDRAT